MPKVKKNPYGGIAICFSGEASPVHTYVFSVAKGLKYWLRERLKSSESSLHILTLVWIRLSDYGTNSFRGLATTRH